jgi:hypothetical protein
LGKDLICEQTEPPFTCTVDKLVKGENVIRAVVTDDEGNVGSNQKNITVVEPV